MFTGDIPFEAPEVKFLTYDDFIDGVRRGLIRPSLPHDMPGWLVKLLHRCWSTDIDNRPAASELLESLEQQFERECGAPLPHATDSSLGSTL